MAKTQELAKRANFPGALNAKKRIARIRAGLGATTNPRI